jgi:hypothetical protein
MSDPNVTEIQLQAVYFAGTESLTLPCCSVSFLPSGSALESVAPVGSIARNRSDGPSLLVRGVDPKALGKTAWNRLLFKDPTTGVQKDFDIQVVDAPEPSTAKFEIQKRN